MDRRALLVCFSGIFVSYFVYGVLQENITKSRYGEQEERFTYTLAMVFVQCVVNAMFAQLAILTSRAGIDTSPQSMYAVMSFSYLGAMIASNHALQFVSYPTQVLGKSIKPIPVMILGVLMARKSYTWKKYSFVLMITAGVALFMYKPSQNNGDLVFGWGEFLLLVSLALDGVTGGVQDKLRAEHKTQTHRMMLWMNLWSLVYLVFALLLTGEGIEFIQFTTKYPVVFVQLLAFSVCSAIGQHFIFMTITKFGPLACSVITTTRKFFTILASVLLFSHPMSPLQWLGTLFVFAGLGLDSIYGKEHSSSKPPRSSGEASNGSTAHASRPGVSTAKNVVFERVADFLQPERKVR